MKLLRWCVPLGLVWAMAGCAGNGSAVQTRVYDLGLGSVQDAKLPARVGAVRAAAPFDTTDMIYRLAYRDASELAAYSQSRWAATPAELVRKSLARRVEAGAPSACVLDIELLEFSQVFTAADASEALIEARAVLSDATGRKAERAVRVALPGAGSSAGSGVAAISKASEQLLSELGAWSAQQSACRR